MIGHGGAGAAPRPAIPAILACACALWIGALGGREAGILFGLTPLFLGGVLVVAALFAGAFVLGRIRPVVRVIAVFVVLFAALGLALSGVSLAHLERTQNELCTLEGGVHRFQVVEDPTEAAFGRSAVLRVVRDDGLPLDPPGSAVLVRAYFEDDAPALGQEFEAHARFFAPSDIGYAAYLRKGVACRAELSDLTSVSPSAFGFLTKMRMGFVEALDRSAAATGIDDESVALVQALVVGDRSDLFTTSLYQEVKATGLAHLVAVSGAHLVIVSGFVKVLLEALRLPQRIRVTLQVSFVCVYVVMVGFPVSCLRAALMSIASVLSLVFRRRSHALSSLGATIIVLISFDPSAAVSLSFSLSVLSTLGIVLFVPLIVSWCPVASRQVRAWILDPVVMTLAATLLTFPLSVSQFAQFPLVAPLSNVVASPFVTLVCGIGALAFVVQPIPLLSSMLLQLACGMGWCFVRTVEALSRVPFCCIPVDASMPVMGLVSIGVAAAMWLIWPRRIDARAVTVGLMACLLCLAVSLIPRLDSELIMLDVGQGDAFVVRSGGACVLVDTGNDPQALYEGLARHGVRRLDGVVVSHADDDHCACLSDLAGVVPCDAVYVARGMKTSDSNKAQELVSDAQRLVGPEGVRELSTGDVVTIGSFRATVISPDELADGGGNADSLCLLLAYSTARSDASWTALLCGDAEAEVLKPLVDEGSLGAVDIYKVGHHGARAALDAELAHALSPRVALVSVGAHNTYGHPNAETLALLSDVGAETLCSDEVGDAVCRFTHERIEVSTMR